MSPRNLTRASRAQFYLAFVGALNSAGRFQEAAATGEKALKSQESQMDPNCIAGIEVRMAYAYYRLAEKDKQQKYIRMAMQQSPSSTIPYEDFWLGNDWRKCLEK